VKIGIVGVGLMGGSLALRLNDLGHALYLDDPDPETQQALRDARLGVVGPWSAWIGEAEVVVVSVPPAQMAPVLEDMAQKVGPAQQLVEWSSVKEPLVSTLQNIGRRVTTISMHPMAGREKRGFKAASRELFCGRPLLFVDYGLGYPDSGVMAWWAGVLEMSVHQLPWDEHDRAIAWISQLPYVVSNALKEAVRGQVNPAWVALAGPGYRDTTRVGESDAAFWVPVLRHNRDELVTAIQAVKEELDRWVRCLSDEVTSKEAQVR
jgi:prephenate dehydrogenase